jgi:diamine N-acetyltransferase
MACSEITRCMMGPPLYPDVPIPSWEAFRRDYEPYYFDDTDPRRGRSFVIEVNGEAIGQINYNAVEVRMGRLATELDIWLRSERDCGKGYGGGAILTLCRRLKRRFGVEAFVMQPSARNPRAIRAYKKIGFAPLPISTSEAQKLWGPADYADSVYMVKHGD